MNRSRQPAAFPLPSTEGRSTHTAGLVGPSYPLSPRKPVAIHPEKVIAASDADDMFDAPNSVLTEPPPATVPRRRSLACTVFFGTFGVLISLAIGLWADSLIRDLFSRQPWLGWLALVMAGTALVALFVILMREFIAVARLAEVEKLQRRALDSIARDDPKTARAIVDELSAFVASKPETAAGRRTLADLRGEVIDGGNLIRLAETEILAPLDARARQIILDAAKRVSLITAVSPRALVDIAYVVFESGRLIRRLSELYGGRPGTLGFFRLARSVLAHLAVTGSIAMGDSIVQQLVGHGLAARLSAKLGEGVVNGMMTVRIGISAMETARPLPFTASKRPRMGDFLSTLTTFAAREAEEKPQNEH